MRALPRRHLSYAGLALLLAVDATALLALLLDQWLVFGRLWVWLIAAALVAVAMPLLLKLVDAVFDAARRHRTIPLTGGSFP